MFLFKYLAVVTALAISINGFADEETRSAVRIVQEQMKSPSFHENAAKESQAARKVQTHVKELTGNPENEQDLYNLAAEVLGNMKDMKPEEMNKTLDEAQRNPASFAKDWTPEQKRKLKELSDRISATKQRNP